MFIRFRVSTSLGDYFGASPLSTVEQDALPKVGDAYDDGRDSYSIVKVLEDVDAESGSDQRGAIVYVMRTGSAGVVRAAYAKQGMALSRSQTSARLLRECIERANKARRTGSSEDYRRHVEEFLFVSSRASQELTSVRGASTIPYLPVYGESEGLKTLLREGLIDSRYAAHVESINSLAAVSSTLERLDTSRPTIFIITEIIDFRSGGDALRLIRAHPRCGDCLILVLSQNERLSEESVAMEAGASAYTGFPDTLDHYGALAQRIRGMLQSASTSDSATVGS